jgi:hypothetical protein
MSAVLGMGSAFVLELKTCSTFIEVTSRMLKHALIGDESDTDQAALSGIGRVSCAHVQA